MKLRCEGQGRETDAADREATALESREVRELFRAFMKYSPVYSYIKEVSPTESRVLYASDNFESMVGIKGSDMVGKTMPELFPEDFAVKMTADDWMVVSKGEVLQLDEDFNGRNYTTIKAPLKQGEKTLLMGYTIDITDRKQAERALRESEAFVKAVMDHLPIGIAVNSVESEVAFVYMNEKFPQFYRTTREALARPDAFWDTVYEDPVFRQEIKQRVLDDCDSGDPERMRWVDVPLSRRGGETRYITAMNARVPGKPLMISTVWDVTDRKRAEDALRRGEERYRQLLENLPVGVYRNTPGPEGRFVFANPFIARLFGFATDEEFLQTRVQDLYEDPEERRAFSEKLLTRGRVQREELRLKRRDGTTIWGAVTAQAVRDPRGEVAYFDGFIEDITERKQAEDEKLLLEAQLAHAQKMESVGRLAGGVAHDFNNMLAVILGRAEMALVQVEASHPLHNHLTEICKAAERSAELTRQLLAFARNQTVAPRVLDLNETVAGTLKMLERLIGENIELVWLPGSNLSPVRIDPCQVDQILANLCVNARDAIAGVGKITIETRDATVDEERAHTLGVIPGHYVRLAVGDDGCGMDPETLAHIFEPFFTTKGVGEGTGLGLSTVYGAVRQNGGFVEARSRPGRGTTVTIHLPRDRSGPGREQGGTAARSLARGRETILLVEDEPAMLDVISAMLASQGYTVLPAGAPGVALRLAREHAGEIDLLVTDVVMPEMNGRALAENLLAVRPELRRLFMSGYTADVIAHHGILEEGVHFIQKPFSVAGLAAKVREVLEA